MNVFDPFAFRQCFPFFNDNEAGSAASIYFDSAATTQKPQVVIDCLKNFYQQQNANVHRGSYQLSAAATSQFEQARVVLQAFINAPSIQEVIWTKGTTEAINLVATSWGLNNLKKGDEILLSYAEHHANFVPWQVVAQKTGATISVLPLTRTGIIDTSKLNSLVNERTRIVCCSHVSNVIGKLNPIEKIIARAKQVGALTLIDGAQAIAHYAIDVQAFDCDFYVFSAHKAYGPMGVGVLYGRKSLLNAMSPYQLGGEMIKKVSLTETTYNDLPFKFEAGTPNVAGCIAFAKAIDFLKQFDESLNVYEQQLVQYCYQALKTIPQVRFLVEECPDIGIFSFTVAGHHNQDIASGLDSFGIAVRNGHHCAMPLMEYLKVTGSIRLSLAPYNTQAEIDFFIDTLKKIITNYQLSTDKRVLITASGNEKSMTINSDNILALFSSLKGWDARHRQIMLLSKKLTKLAPEQRSQKNLITGCESKAWLNVSKTVENTYIFTADSEAKIIKGLLVIVLAAFNDKTAEQILAFNIEDYFKKLGLLSHLSPSRSNGLNAIVKKIKSTVKEL